MKNNTGLGKIFGIPIRLHWTWFLIFGLVTLSLALGYFPVEQPGLPVPAYWILGAVTSLLFFSSVLLHELGHSLVALRNQIPVRDITLFIFGGMAQIEREPKSPGAEFRIAVAGPLTSLGLAALFGILWQLDRTVPYLAAPSIWLMRINLALGLFNLIPGFPLDGGRVLRAVVWKISGDFHRATQVASASGQLIAFGFIGLGFLTMLTGGFFNGLWLAAIGWFLQNAAAASSAQANLQHLLRGVTVGQVMNRECLFIPGRTSLRQLVDEQVLSGGRRCFFVGEDRRMLGLLTLADVARIPRTDWEKTTASQAMVTLERTVRVRAEDMLLAALKVMDDANVNQVPVMEGDELAGFLSREHVLHYVRTRAELGV
ncbi:MAG: site-2 protease family protein [Anaerolineales bacterium]|nr:site-2 protease family protein [Anaerolineales bacterium]